MRVQQGDTVVVISGKDKGKTGTVLRVLTNKGRVVVTDINMRKKHVRGTPQRPGQIVQYEASIDASNVMLIDPKTKKRTRVGYKRDEKGKKQRIAKKSGDVIKKNVAVASKKEEKVATEKSAPKKEDKKTEAKKKEEKVATTTDTEKPAEKGPFWKRFMGGGQSSDIEGEEGRDGDGSTDQSKSTRTRGSQRGS